MSAEDQRKTANLIKQGNIAESDPAGRVRVRIGNLLTDWLPYFVPFAGGVSVHRPPSVGENCLVLSPSGATTTQTAALPPPASKPSFCRPPNPCASTARKAASPVR